jgi:uncharacterized protein YdhG (YjbR/CyaY superfamily)
MTPADETANTAATTNSAATATAQIDAYLATLPEDMRTALEALRRTIQAAAPEAVEAISYGAPAFRYRDRPLVAYRAARAHCAFYPMNPAVIDAHRDELKAFDTAKGTIRFTPARPMPETLVTRIVEARVAETEAGASK